MVLEICDPNFEGFDAFDTWVMDFDYLTEETCELGASF